MTFQEKEKKWVQPLTLPQEGSNRILPTEISIVSCSPPSSCYKLIILLLSYCHGSELLPNDWNHFQMIPTMHDTLLHTNLHKKIYPE